MKPIKILGAGVSGLTAAINLAKSGYKVDVFERNKDVGVRFGGDLQGFENWSEKEDVLDSLKRMNIEINFDCDPFSKISISNVLTIEKIELGKSIFYMLKRGGFLGSFDYGLKEQAIKAGVNIHFNETLPQEEVDIIATGPVMSEIAIMAKGIIFETKSEDILLGMLSDDAAYKAYSYLIIAKGYGCMCSVVSGDFKRVNECFDKTVEKFNKIKKFDIQNPKNIGGVGCFSAKNIFKKGNNLFVGEAAGLQDILWGFGMRHAIVSGYMAARSIIENRNYEEMAANYFNNKLKASIANRFLWEVASLFDYSYFISKAKQSKDLFGSLHSFHNYNFLQKIVYPLALLYVKKKYLNLKL